MGMHGLELQRKLGVKTLLFRWWWILGIVFVYLSWEFHPPTTNIWLDDSCMVVQAQHMVLVAWSGSKPNPGVGEKKKNMDSLWGRSFIVLSSHSYIYEASTQACCSRSLQWGCMGSHLDWCVATWQGSRWGGYLNKGGKSTSCGHLCFTKGIQKVQTRKKLNARSSL